MVLMAAEVTVSFLSSPALAMSHDKAIISNACVMSYTDAFGRAIRVIRSNPLTVYLK